MHKSRVSSLIIWAVASIFYAYQYILRVMPSIMMNDILQQFQIDSVMFGQFSGIYYIGYSLMHLPVGIMLDHYGPKKVMPICILITILGLLPLMFAEFWVYPILGRLLTGMGSSAAILGTFKIIRLTFNEDKFTRMLSLSVTIGLIGGIYGGGPVNYMCNLLGYKYVIAIFVVIGIVLSILTYYLVPNIKPERSNSVLSNIKEVFCTPKVLAICFFAGCMVGPLEGFADVWGAAFLKQVYGFENSIAVSLPSAIFIGMCFGAPVLSLIAEKTKSYLGTIVASGIIMAGSFVALLVCSMNSVSIGIMFVVVGVCCSYQIIAIYKASTYVKEHAAGLTTAVANMVIMSFGYVFHTIIGWTINVMGGPNDSKAFVYGVLVIPVALAIGSIGFYIIILSEHIKKKARSTCKTRANAS